MLEKVVEESFVADSAPPKEFWTNFNHKNVKKSRWGISRRGPLAKHFWTNFNQKMLETVVEGSFAAGSSPKQFWKNFNHKNIRKSHWGIFRHGLCTARTILKKLQPKILEKVVEESLAAGSSPPKHLWRNFNQGILEKVVGESFTAGSSPPKQIWRNFHLKSVRKSRWKIFRRRLFTAKTFLKKL